jgi:hypothetical protein
MIATAVVVQRDIPESRVPLFDHTNY